MAVRTRATDSLSQRDNEVFSDFLDSFKYSPFGNDLSKVTNVKAINQALRNLVYTNLGERLFQPDIGCDVYAILFQLTYTEQTNFIKRTIAQSIKLHEPRALLQDIVVKFYDDQPNSVEIDILYTPINNPEPQTLTVILKRVR
jgi:phage baseplate assembly protein W